MLTTWLVVEILSFRKLCNGFGLNLNLEPGNKVDFDFVVENCVKIIIENPSISPCQSLLKRWSPLLYPYHPRNNYYMQSFFFQQLISDYITVGVAARNYFLILVTAAGRGTERPQVTITYDSTR